MNRSFFAGGVSRRLISGVTAGAAVLTLFLSGCMNKQEQTTGTSQAGSGAAAAIFREKAPAEAGAGYTARGEFRSGDTAASMGKIPLTNGELGVFYRLVINGYRPGAGEPSPDWSQPLENQLRGEITWQQYFLDQALELWHSFQALEQQSKIPTTQDEENFDPIPKLHEEYMKDMPANALLYDMDTTFKPNSMHMKFLGSLSERVDDLARDKGYGSTREFLDAEFGPGTRKDDLLRAARLGNWAYMYFTELTYDLDPTPEEIQAMITQETGPYVVDLRHILIVPEGGKQDAQGRVTAEPEQWEEARDTAESLLGQWQKGRREESRFAALAHDYSGDPGSALNGGFYGEIRQGQMDEALDKWCFDPARAVGDTAVLKSDFGWHVVYLSAKRDSRYVEIRTQLRRMRTATLAETARKEFPIQVNYEKIQLQPLEGRGQVTFAEDLLYPDVAHERFPEVPVYIQQDYKKAPYGAWNVSSHGCGITAMAMLATYMSDTELTPAMLAARYGSYNSLHGTDTSMFIRTPPEMGFYVIKPVFSWQEAEEALRAGHQVVNLQTKGYWTRTGHFLVLTKWTDDNMVVVRDSNIYNYKRLPGHSVDKFDPKYFPASATFYWIYDYKITRIPACARCGEGETIPGLFREEYLCPKCRTAMARRDTFLNLVGLQ